jgi:hypothetical protein
MEDQETKQEMTQWGFVYTVRSWDHLTCFSGPFDSYEAVLHTISCMADECWDEGQTLSQIEDEIIDNGELTAEDIRYTFGIRIFKISEEELPGEAIANKWKEKIQENKLDWERQRIEQDRTRELAELERLKKKYGDES